MTDEFESLPPSKTQRKHEAHARQDIGERLVELSVERLAALHLPEDLRRAVLEAKRLRAHGARRRQMQYLGKLMRRVEVEPILAQLEAITQGAQIDAARLHAVERWRERLLTDDDALAQFLKDYPHTQSQPLRTLIRNAHKEQAEQQPPKSSRALFRALRDILLHAADGHD
jgi:ribosome-associated protein